MIAKIGRSSNLIGTLSYNNSKIEQDKGEILMTNKMIETADRKYSVTQLARSFEPYLLANRKTEKHTLHISLNPDPKDKVSDEHYQEMAQLYMGQMGYGDQPFVVFKHTDIDRSHIHIVSVCVDEDGRKISDKFEKIRSMKVCREMEKKFGLISAIEKKHQQNQKIFQPVNYKNGNIKSQMASVILQLQSYYQFQSLGEFNALLSVFNITSEKVEGELQGQLKRGLVYFPLNDKGEKVGSPIKASLFGKKASIDHLEKFFDDCKMSMKGNIIKSELSLIIRKVCENCQDENSFKRALAQKGVDTVIRKNENGRIYGITFIDHRSRMVWNGSRLGKDFSANEFNNQWSNKEKEAFNEDSKKSFNDEIFERTIDNLELINPLFSDGSSTALHLFESLAGLIPETQTEDYEENDFAHRMKRKSKTKRRY